MFKTMLKQTTFEMYGNIVPRNITSPSFKYFVTRADSLASTIQGHVGMRDPRTKTRFEFSATSPTAFTDGERIVLPAIYLLPNFYDVMRIEPAYYPDAALACVNGSQIHEALHIVLTDFSALDNFGSKLVEEDRVNGTSYSQYIGQIWSIGNLIEDIYIERSEYIHRFPPMFRDILALKNMVFFNNDVMIDAVEMFYEKQDMESVIALLAFYKLHDVYDSNDGIDSILRNISPKLAKVADTMLYAVDESYMATTTESALGSTEARLDYAFMIFKLLMDDANGEEYEPKAGTKGMDAALMAMAAILQAMKSDGGEDDGGDGESSHDAEIDKLIEQLLDEVDPDGTNRKLIAATVNRMLEESYEELQQEHSVQNSIENKIRVPKYVNEDISAEIDDRPRFKLHKDARWAKFSEFLKYATQDKHAPMIPSDEQGQIISANIARIAIDNRILGLGKLKKQRGVPEIIVLLDMSGSMHGKASKAPYTSLIQEAASAAWGLYMSCERGRVPIAVYGHTSKQPGYKPVIFNIAAYNMPLTNRNIIQTTNNPTAKFEAVARHDMVVNYDGIAIDFVSRRFTEKPGTKLLLVISDGEPSGNGDYDGGGALDHTIYEIKEARKRGVNVFALSVSSGVVYSNNRIYGQKYNVDASRGNLDQEMQRFVMQLISG